MAKLEDEVKMNQKVQVEQEGFEPRMSGRQPSDLATRLRSQDDKLTELSRTVEGKVEKLQCGLRRVQFQSRLGNETREHLFC